MAIASLANACWIRVGNDLMAIFALGPEGFVLNELFAVGESHLLMAALATDLCVRAFQGETRHSVVAERQVGPGNE